jgi:metal-responsive CopG/Arc/MetJ family transcriptional regulator
MAKVAISLPNEVLEEVESLRERRKESRSEFFRRAIDELLRKEREREAVARYIQAYKEMPETEEEIEAADRASNILLAQEPWDD